MAVGREAPSKGLAVRFFVIISRGASPAAAAMG